MIPDPHQLNRLLENGKLIRLPVKRTKRTAALLWLAAHIPLHRTFDEPGFNVLLNQLHTFHDPALLRRELFEAGLISRTVNGSSYRRNEPLMPQTLRNQDGREQAGFFLPEYVPEPRINTAEFKTVNGSDPLRKEAASYRAAVHAEALARVRRILPEAEKVADRYPLEAYIGKVWDYPGAWYPIATVPERAGSREALLETIVLDTIALNG